MTMFCELLNKNVQIEVAQEVRAGSGNIVKKFYKCSGCIIEIGGVKMQRPCEKMRDEKCLLKHI